MLSERGSVAPASENRRYFLAASLATLTLGGTGAWWIGRRGNVYVSDVGKSAE